VPAVLLTGAARGIGRAAVERLAGSGWDVYAGVREPLDFGVPGITPVVLDITDAEQIAALDAALPERLDAVVNNAGVVVEGPLEALTPDDLRRQFEVNVIGQVAVTNAVLPRLRASKGRVVFVTSVSGLVSTPFIGAYCGSKFALEGMADALRVELRPWGIKVVIVEPNSTDTDMWRTADERGVQAAAGWAPEHQRLYEKHTAGMRKLIATVGKRTVPATDVVDAIETALTAARPRARYPVGIQSRIQIAAATVTPAAVMDRVLSAAHGFPRKLD
jgi:NAD(P)-dependent dehydrogenase (short-subunit alcohol dehydrogenase family)